MLGSVVKTLVEMPGIQGQVFAWVWSLVLDSSFVQMHTLKDQMDGSSSWVSVIHMEGLDWVPGSCFCSNLAPCAIGIWRVNQGMSALYFVLSPSLILFLFLFIKTFYKSNVSQFTQSGADKATEKDGEWTSWTYTIASFSPVFSSRQWMSSDIH